MFTADAAKLIGIKPKALRAFLRTHYRGVGSGARYEFTYEQVQELTKAYWATQGVRPIKTASSTNTWLGDGGRPPLSALWLNDPSKLPEFIAERQLRQERLSKRLREVGLDVPQMRDRDLAVNNRAIARAILLGDYNGLK